MLMVWLMLLLLLLGAAKFPRNFRLAHKSSSKFFSSAKKTPEPETKSEGALSFLFLDSLALSSSPVVNQIRYYIAWQAPASLVAWLLCEKGNFLSLFPLVRARHFVISAFALKKTGELSNTLSHQGRRPLLHG